MEHKNRFPVRGLQGRLTPKLQQDRLKRRRSRGAIARVLGGVHPLSFQSEGARNAGCRLHPLSAREELRRMRALTDRFSRDNPAFPAQWFYGFLRALLGEPAGCHRHQRNAQTALSRTWRLHRRARTTRLRRPQLCRSSSTHPRPPHPASRVVTIAIRPSCRGGTAREWQISEKKKGKYFCRKILNGASSLIALGKFRFSRTPSEGESNRAHARGPARDGD